MKNGFSLVELSIVLVILGLLTGGILAGQNLIRAAELRSVSTDVQRFQTAAQTFRDRYFALPGDMRNATAFWGEQNASPATCKTTASTSALTCDGDGDGMINHNATVSNEVFRAWQHLANAGLIEGSYTGVKRSGATDERAATPGENIPRGKVGEVGFMVASYANRDSDGNWFDGDYNNILWIGKEYGAQEPFSAFLSPEEAWNIDTKMDDSSPAYGFVRTLTPVWGTATNCATTAVESTAEYNLLHTAQACFLIVMGVF